MRGGLKGFVRAVAVIVVLMALLTSAVNSLLYVSSWAGVPAGTNTPSHQELQLSLLSSPFNVALAVPIWSIIQPGEAVWWKSPSLLPSSEEMGRPVSE